MKLLTEENRQKEADLEKERRKGALALRLADQREEENDNLKAVNQGLHDTIEENNSEITMANRLYNQGTAQIVQLNAQVQMNAQINMDLRKDVEQTLVRGTERHAKLTAALTALQSGQYTINNAPRPAQRYSLRVCCNTGEAKRAKGDRGGLYCLYGKYMAVTLQFELETPVVPFTSDLVGPPDMMTLLVGAQTALSAWAGDNAFELVNNLKDEEPLPSDNGQNMKAFTKGSTGVTIAKTDIEGGGVAFQFQIAKSAWKKNTEQATASAWGLGKNTRWEVEGILLRPNLVTTAKQGPSVRDVFSLVYAWTNPQEQLSQQDVGGGQYLVFEEDGEVAEEDNYINAKGGHLGPNRKLDPQVLKSKRGAPKKQEEEF